MVDGCPPALGRHRVAQLVVVEQRAKSIGKPLRERAGLTRNPCRPSSISSWKPEIRLAATARPQLMASSSTMPNEALSQGVQKTSPVTR